MVVVVVGGVGSYMYTRGVIQLKHYTSVIASHCAIQFKGIYLIVSIDIVDTESVLCLLGESKDILVAKTGLYTSTLPICFLAMELNTLVNLPQYEV